jgi:GTP-binding protein
LHEAGVEEVFTISGATGEGVPALLDAVLPLLGDIGIARQAFEEFDEDEDEATPEDKPWSPL